MSIAYLVGIGPGAVEYITLKAKSLIEESDIVVGYRHTIESIRSLIKDGKDVRVITLKTQDEVYNSLLKELKGDELSCSILFTGDVNFSESEIVDRLVELFSYNGIEVKLIPGISSIQVAAAYSKVPLDKATILTFHVTGSIEDRKDRLIEALKESRDVILLPRPWDFMPYHIYRFIEDNGVDVSSYDVEIYENLTLKNESITRCRLDELSDRAYSDLCIMVLKHKKG